MRTALWCWLLLILSCGPAHAAPATPRLADLHRAFWTSKDGAPTDIVSMTQTADGWLWMATTNGLYRFDGVRFEHFQPRPGEALLDARLARLYAAPDGALWFGYSGGGGIGELRNGRLHHHAPAWHRPGAMQQAHQDLDGSLWVATMSGMMHHANGAWSMPGPEQGLPSGRANAVFVDQYGNVWANIDEQLFVRRHGSQQFTPVAAGKNSQSILASPDGRLWVDAGHRIAAIAAPHAGAARPARPGRGMMTSQDWLFDRAGNFWTTNCPATLCLVHASALAGKTAIRVADTPKDALAGERLNRGLTRALFEDAEGNVWAATSEGLERYRPQRIDRLPMDRQYAEFLIANDGPNALWVMTKPQGHLWRVAGAALTRVPGTAAYSSMNGNGSIGRPVLFFSNGRIAQRRQGQLQEEALHDGAGRRIVPPLTANNGTFDGKDYWAYSISGPVRLVDGQWRAVAQLGFPAGARLMNADRAGGVWLLYEDRMVDATRTPWHAYGKEQGLDVGRLHRVVAREAVLALGNSGVAVKIGERFYPLRTDRPDLLANAMASMESANGDLWINARDGLLRVQAADWKAWLAHPDSLLKIALFDSADGAAGTRTTQPAWMATTDNGKRVWFVDQKGLASIDSTTVSYNRIAPRVEVTRLRAGTLAFFGDHAIRLGAGTRNLAIDYTALSFTMPERLRFKYRLVGLDAQWQDGGARRTMAYTNLGPGDYRFEVLAANEDGVWGARPATMAFSIAPLFVQTWWFFALCALLAAAALAGLYWLRMRSVHKHFAGRMHARMLERERIARSLHDTYLQSVQGLIYVFHGVAQNLPAAAASQGALERALALADEVLIQGREQVLGLRTLAGSADTLAQSLAGVGEALAQNAAMTCTISTSGAMRTLRGLVMEELFWIGREALQNAFRHSRGTTVKLMLHYDARQFTLSIEDDGIGLPTAMLAHGQRDGHWGLPGMRERARAVHGALALSHAPGGGACIVLAVPGRSAYIGRGPAWQALARWWRAR